MDKVKRIKEELVNLFCNNEFDSSSFVDVVVDSNKNFTSDLDDILFLLTTAKDKILDLKNYLIRSSVQ